MKVKSFLCILIGLGFFSFIFLAPISVHAALYSTSLDFETSNQNMWGGGEATVLADTYAVGFGWNESFSVGGFLGGPNTTIIPGGCLPWPLSSVCWDPVTADTTTGATLGGSTSGYIGIEAGYKVNSGSIDASYSADVEITYPDDNTVYPGETFNVSSQVVSSEAEFDTTFPNVEAYVDLIFEIEADLQAAALVLGVGPDIDVTLIDIDQTFEIVGFNRDGDGQLVFLGSDTGLVGGEIDLGPYADMTVTIPTIETQAYSSDPDVLTSEGETDFLEFGIDVDQIATTLLGLPPLSGEVAGVLGYDILDVDVGAELNILQEFTWDPDLLMSLSPSYGTGAGMLPVETTVGFEMGNHILDITPTFELDNDFTNLTDLSIIPEIELAALEAWAFGLSLGPLFGPEELQFDIFPRINVFDDTFPLDFAAITTESFSVEPVPEPATMLLLGSGLIGLAGFGRRRKRKIN